MTEGMTNTQLLKNKALTVRLYRKKPNRNMMDKTLSQELRDRLEVTDKVGLRVNKSILPKETTKPYMDIMSEAGKYYYKTTTPWDDKGNRLLAVSLYEDFTRTFKDFTRRFRVATDEFINSIEGQIETMQGIMGKAFCRDDYNHMFLSNGQLDRDAILGTFQLEIEFGTVSDGDDLRASLTDDDRQIIADHITEVNNKKFAKTQKHIITTLHEAIMAIHTRLCEKKNVFRDTLISNLEELCDLIPKMNIANDPALNQIAVDAKAKLCKWDPQTLRDNEDTRKDVAEEADKLVKNMAGLM